MLVLLFFAQNKSSINVFEITYGVDIYSYFYLRKCRIQSLVMPNKTSIREFILLGHKDGPELQVVIFFFMLFTYLLSVSGNMNIIMSTLFSVCLKTPMYFFLRNFSFLEISFTMVYIPRFLSSPATGDTIISYNVCMTQVFFFFLIKASTEFFLLAVMSYDCNVALCKPLHYTTIMSNRVCNQLVISSWLAAFLIIFPSPAHPDYGPPAVFL